MPSGSVTLAVEKELAPATPVAAEDPAFDAAVPFPEWVVVVSPLIVVDDETCPPPAVTELDVVPVLLPPIVSVTVQVVPSSSVTVSAGKAGSALRIGGIKARTKTTFGVIDAEVMVSPPFVRVESG